MSEDEVVGTAVIRVVVDESGTDRDIDRAVQRQNRRTEQNSRTQGRRNGEEYGDQFTRSLRTRMDAAIRALPKGDIDLNDESAQGKLRALRATIEGMGEERLGIKLDDREVYSNLLVLRTQLEELTGPEHDIDVRLNARTALAEIEALRKSVEGVDNKPPKTPTTPKKLGDDASKSKKEFNLLRVAIEQLGPPLVPLAGGALGVLSAFAGLGAAGFAAVKGISVEYKNGTALGQKYGAMLRVTKDDLAQTERIAARGVYAGVEKSVSKLNAEMPALNDAIGQSSEKLGDIASHAIGGVVGGFVTFNPLMQKAETYVDGLAARFEKWATGPGGAHFAQTLSDDMDHAIPAIEGLAGAVTHVISAFDNVGSGGLDEITVITHAIEAIPVDVLSAAATAYVAWRTAVLITKPFELAAGALTKFAVAERTAAVATEESAAAGAGAGAAGAAGAAATRLQRTAGGLAAITTRLAPYAAGWLGASIAIGAADRATEDWRQSADGGKAALGSVVHFMDQIAHFHPIDAFKGLIGDADAAADRIHRIAEAQSDLNRIGVGGASRNILEGTFAHQQAPLYGAGNETIKVTNQAIDEQRAKVAQLGAQLATGRAQMESYTARERELTAAGKQGSDQFYETQANARNLDKFLTGLGERYQAAKDRLQGYTDTVKNARAAQEILRAEVEKSSRAYSDQIAHSLNVRLNNAFAQSPTVTSGVTALQSYSKSVAEAVKAEKTWTDVTDDNTIQIGKNQYELSAWDAALAKSNGDKTKAAGLLEGHTTALKLDQDQLRNTAEMQSRLSGSLGAAEDKYKLNDQQLNLYALTLGVTASQLATGAVSQQDFVKAVGEVKGPVDDAGQALSGFLVDLQSFEAGADTAATRGQLLASAMRAINGDAIGLGVAGSTAAQANQQFVDAFDKAGKGVVDLKTGMIDLHNAGAQPLFSALSQLQNSASQYAAAVYQSEVSTRGQTQAARDAAKVFRNDTHGALVAEAKQLGITRGEAGKLADRYFHWPKKATTTIAQLGAASTSTILTQIRSVLEYISGKKWDFTVDANYTARARTLLNSAAARKSGIGISIADGGMFEYYASGGARRENHVAQVVPAGTYRVFAEDETGGEAYVPMANDWRRPRAKSITQQVAAKFGGEVVWHAAGSGPPGDTGGYTGVTTPTNTAAAAAAKTASAAATKLSNEKSAVGNQLHSLISSLAGSIKQVEAAERSLIKSVAQIPGSSKLVEWLRNEDKALNQAVIDRNRVSAELGKARDHLRAELQIYNTYRNQVISAERDSFDISTAGTGPNNDQTPTFDRIYSEAIYNRNQVHKVRTIAEKLIREGMDPDYIAELTAKGPGALPQLEALALASPAQIRKLNGIEADVRRDSSKLGTEAANYLYGESVATARALIDGFNPKNKRLASDVRKLADSMYGVGKLTTRSLARGLESEDKLLIAAAKRIADTIERGIKKSLGMKSPSTKGIAIGANFAVSSAKGIENNTHHAERAAARLGTRIARAVNPGAIQSTSAPSAVPAPYADPRIDGVLNLMAQFFSEGFTLEANGQELGRFVQEQLNVLARFS